MTLASSNSASLHVRAGIGGEPVVDEVQACGALAFQAAQWGVWLVNSAGHPIGGDILDVKIGVDVGCCLDVRSFAPTIAKAGNEAARQRMGRQPSSTTRYTVNVASDAVLAWCPEPGIATKACEHLNESLIQLAANARLVWREEFLLDRRGGVRLGSWRSRIRVVRDGWPVVATELTLGPLSELWESPVALEGARAVSHFIVIDPGQVAEDWKATRNTVASATGVGLPLAGPGIQFTAWGDDLLDCRETVGRMLGSGGVPEWARSRWTATDQVRAMEPEHRS